MKVFLSWSGKRSYQVAQALRDWLPGVLQDTEPWLSSLDIAKGERWFDTLTSALQETRLALICLTKDNLNTSWLHFEVGAVAHLAQAEGNAPLYVYSLDVELSDVMGPLSQFQFFRAEKADTFALLQVLNSAATGPRLSEANLQRAFELWWPQLRAALDLIPSDSTAIRPMAASLDEKIDKVITLLENLAAGQQPTAGPAQKPPTSTRPRAFIDSSSEGLPIANAIQEILDPVAECTIWNQGVFAPSSTFIESLQDARLLYDFAIVVLTADDTITSRGRTDPAPRDNLLFELGLFAGALGRARTFLVVPADSPPRLPSDLSGVTTTKYRSRSDSNLVAALGPAMSQIMRAMGLAGAGV